MAAAAGSPRGTYLAIAETLRAQLVSDRPPETLPSEQTLAADHGVARTTIRRALKALEAEGLIVSQHGVGWQPARNGADRRPLVERITEKIRADKLEVGAKVPSEAELCGTFSVSRTAVRGALAQLEGRGILEAIPGRGRLLRALPPTDLSS